MYNKKIFKGIILAAIPIILLTIPQSIAISINPIILKDVEISTQKTPFTEDLLIEMFPKVNESKIYEYVKTMQDFGPHPTQSSTIENVGNYIYNKFITLGIQVEYDPWEVNDVSGKNIIATLQGKSDGIIIVTAHYDTIEISPGADDDGSGIASILMIAEIMSKYSYFATVKFMIFSGEEIGLLGSKDYARRAFEQNSNIIGVLSIDKVGYANTADDGKKIRHHADKKSEWMIDISAELSKKYNKQIGLEVVRLPIDSSSDHKAFVKYGFSGSNLVEESLNPTYHTSEDIINYINITYLAKVTKLALGITAKMSSLNPILDENDIKVKIKGSYLSKPALLNINVENKKHSIDTANVTITIEMKHIIRDTYVLSKKKYYTDPCIWNFTKEIDKNWEFKLGGRSFSRGLCRVEVTIRGIKDDIKIYKKENTTGIIFIPYEIFLIPIS